MWNEEKLDEILSCPGEAVIEDLSGIEGDIMIPGAGGKVGPTLSVMCRRASEKCGRPRKVYAISRFSDPYVVALLKRERVETITADLTDEAQIAALPRVPNIIFMAGRKFGTSQNARETWEMNVAVPAMITRHFGAARYVVFSTGNVYPFSAVAQGSCDEGVPPPCIPPSLPSVIPECSCWKGFCEWQWRKSGNTGQRISGKFWRWRGAAAPAGRRWRRRGWPGS